MKQTKNVAPHPYDPNDLKPSRYYIRPRHGKVKPFYSRNADYNTDAPSYYEYLAKYNELLDTMIDQINDNTTNIDLIWDAIDDLQAQIDVINNRLDIIEADIEQIKEDIREINAKIDTIFKRFQKSIYADSSLDFNGNTYSTFAQAFLDYTKVYLDEYYSPISNQIGGNTYDIHITDSHIINLTNALIKEFYPNANEYSAYTIHGHNLGQQFNVSGYLEIIGEGDNAVFYFTMDNYGDLTGSDTPNVNLFKGQNIYSTSIFIDGEKFIPERSRSFVAFDGIAHLLDSSELALSMHGYVTGNVERVRLRFGNFDPDNNFVIDLMNFNAEMYNGYEKLGFTSGDGFYNIHFQEFPVNMTGTPSRKGWDVNFGGVTLYGHSGSAKNEVFLRNIEILIYDNDWRSDTVIPSSARRLEGYTLMRTDELKGDEQYIFMDKFIPNLCYNIYDLTDDELETFKQAYNEFVID